MVTLVRQQHLETEETLTRGSIGWPIAPLNFSVGNLKSIKHGVAEH
jgi:hypothetical protein